MRFHKHVSEEAREFLRELLIEYKKDFIMTPDERKELHKWVAKGRSPYENGYYICGGNGGLIDFVGALRAINEINDDYVTMDDEELTYFHNATNPDDFHRVSDYDDIDFPELPFS
jgi:hypothetical protein